MISTDPLGSIRDAATAYAAAAQDDASEPVSEHLASIPVPTRLLLAAAILAAADKPVSTVNLCAVADVSRGSAYNHHKQQMAVIREAVPTLVRAQLGLIGETPPAAVLYEQIRDRDASIQALRARNDELTRERDTALAYARDLHERLKPEFDDIARERAEKVRPLRSVRTPADPD